MVLRDPVWMASVRRTIDPWRTTRHQPLPVVRFADLAELDAAASDRRLLDIVEVSSGELSSTADWIRRQRGKNRVAALLCRQAFTDPEDRTAAAQLLREAGAVATIATPQDARRLAELLYWLYERSPGVEDPLDELPLPCWAPPWQPRR